MTAVTLKKIRAYHPANCSPEQEVMHVYWSDVNLKASTVKVTHKPDRGWTSKAYKEREIPKGRA